tara:strand:- start:57 stop:527 length:471 start_codon:yes stop_codon:yes gene_type:complete
LKNKISKEDVINAQRLWADNVIQIGDLYTNNGDYKKAAYDFVSNFYAYGFSNVLFKPTLASESQFRLKFDDALSYFIGGSIIEDKGFALKIWKKIRFGDRYFILEDNTALVMGNYYFQTSSVSQEVKVEYTFGYIKNNNGELIINLHHSSLPYQGD